MVHQKRTMRLGAIIDGPGSHIAAWRHPSTPVDAQLDFAFHLACARTLERGMFDCLFVPDVVALWGTDVEHISKTARNEHFEPLSLLAAYAAGTDHIGLASTATTTYNEPYDIARRFTSLDRISGGRAGWNVVTSAAPWESRNFGHPEHMEHDRRYVRAEEFIGVTKRLWATGPQAGAARESRHAHCGEFFDVQGPLNLPASPQGSPVIFQAGASPVGREFAARHAEVIFTRHTQLSDGQETYADLKRRVTAHGRDPERVQIWPGVQPLVAGTEEEARRLINELHDLVPDIVAIRALQEQLGDLDLTRYPLDGPVPDIPTSNRSSSTRRMWTSLAHRENLTLRQLALRQVADFFAGTPEQVADHLERGFTERAADGYVVDFPHLPSSLDAFVDHVVPELRRRGLVQDEYTDGTLREKLGLVAPCSDGATRTGEPALQAGAA
ncbi:NtaA/DmoA family FMN-dependent monooxygenase [Streptomyces xantholiticus]|uniref:NtaA/DmoA family FMN-dependent monooxygenase n=1 Tax=Streptomyces xantholiticus TaxID=68285 RepID=UPI001679822D|nr:NtaA/DmoA family FMN-dependent monooxygenase [Streptomyces xantholiticus]GGW74825.1 monooxygenase [Streptomyces xantholiticus]